MRSQAWYEGAVAFVDRAPSIAYHGLHLKDDSLALPILHDTHDWYLDTPFIRVDDAEKQAIVKQMQQMFITECRRDPEDDSQGLGGEDFELHYSSRRLDRQCILCPVGFSPLVSLVLLSRTVLLVDIISVLFQGTNAGRLKIHIQAT